MLQTQKLTSENRKKILLAKKKLFENDPQADN